MFKVGVSHGDVYVLCSEASQIVKHASGARVLIVDDANQSAIDKMFHKTSIIARSDGTVDIAGIAAYGTTHCLGCGSSVEQHEALPAVTPVTPWNACVLYFCHDACIDAAQNAWGSLYTFVSKFAAPRVAN